MSEDKKDNDKYQPKSEPNTLQDQAWKRALENSKPNAGTPHDWEDYEQQKDNRGEKT